MTAPVNFSFGSSAYASYDGYQAQKAHRDLEPGPTPKPIDTNEASFTLGEEISFASSALSAVIGNIAANRQNRATASALREQAGIYDSQAALGLEGAKAYAQQAGAAAALGRGNARSLRLAAAQLDRYEQYRLRESVMQARSRIGQARTKFAGNGILVDSGSAAMWEQDEAADAALERLDIMQQFEDRSWTYRMQANKAEAEGYAAAAQQAGAAAQAAGQAYAARLQANSARAAAARAKRRKSWGATIGSIVGAIGGLATGTSPAAGSAIGASAGGVMDAFA